MTTKFRSHRALKATRTKLCEQFIEKIKRPDVFNLSRSDLRFAANFIAAVSPTMGDRAAAHTKASLKRYKPDTVDPVHNSPYRPRREKFLSPEAFAEACERQRQIMNQHRRIREENRR